MPGYRASFEELETRVRDQGGTGRNPAAFVIPETIVQRQAPAKAGELTPAVLAYHPELVFGIRQKFLLLQPSLAFAGIVDYLLDIQPRRTTNPITAAIVDSEGIIGVNTTASPIALALLCSEYELLKNIRQACIDLELSEDDQETVAYLVATKFKHMDELPGVARTKLK